jgi:hypothetical protein
VLPIARFGTSNAGRELLPYSPWKFGTTGFGKLPSGGFADREFVAWPTASRAAPATTTDAPVTAAACRNRLRDNPEANSTASESNRSWASPFNILISYCETCG